MDFSESFLPAFLVWGTAVFVVTLTFYFVQSVQWFSCLKKEYLNVWLISIFILGLIWMIRASLQSGLNIHLLGSMLLTLMFGWRLGVLGMTLVNVLVCVWGNGLIENLGLSIIIYAYFSITFCYLYFLLVERFLPRNFYVYLFVTAFFGSSLSFIVTGTVSVIILGLLNVYTWSILIEEYLPFYYLMSFSEAFLSCGVITLLVVYRPQWVYSFRDNRYLIGK